MESTPTAGNLNLQNQIEGYLSHQYLRHLPKKTEAVFSSYRPHLKEVRIVRDRNGDSRGFGFLTFDTLEQAVRVYNSGEDVPFHLDGNDLELGLYITGLDWNATETDVKDFFSQFGPVESVYIGRFPDGRSRGLAIVVFDHLDDAVNVYESNEAEPYFFFKRHLKISYKANPTSTLQHKKTDTVALVGAKPLVEAEVKALVDGFNVKKVDLNSPRIQYITLVKFEDAKTASQAYDEINRRKVKSANILYSMFVDGSEASGRKQGNAADDQWPCS
ncbi:hypothetical protein BDQ17DRAFT_1501149 [Cyathus striatus]|nr:hypothetical protein BDQ17DRAFT_1501149 [Cyathus striatus]